MTRPDAKLRLMGKMTRPADIPIGRLTYGPPDQRHELKLVAGSVTLGRSPSNDIVLTSDNVSRTHARIVSGNGQHLLEDLRSTNGVLVNGEPITRHTLTAGDRITIGADQLKFDRPAVRRSSEVEPSKKPRPVEVILDRIPRPHVVVVERGVARTVSLVTGVLTIGRGPTCEVVLESSRASRLHARIERRGKDAILTDLGSVNGTEVNGMRVDKHSLQDGDTIQIGSARIVFCGEVDLSVDNIGIVDHPPARNRIPVVLVPGILGSELWRGSDRLWPSLHVLMNEPELLGTPDKNPLDAPRIVNSVVVVPGVIQLDQYARLGDYLIETLGYERGVDFMEFAYDWRVDVRDSAKRLGAAIEAWRKRERAARAPVAIIAHSLGNFVARYYIERLGGRENVRRFLSLAGPHQGAPRAYAALLRGEKLLPVGPNAERMRRMFLTIPSLYQGVPAYECTSDHAGGRVHHLHDESWLGVDHRHHLEAARALRAELPARSSVPTVCVFGYGLPTLSGVTCRRGPSGWSEVAEVMTDAGDDLVPEASAVLPNAEIHPVRQHHGAIYTDNDVKMRLRMELTGGAQRSR